MITKYTNLKDTLIFMYMITKSWTLPTMAVKKWHKYISMRPSVGPLIAGRIRVLVK